jgi:hypothetical protein
MGAGVAALDGQHVLLAGGVLPDGSSAGTRLVDLACSAQCAPVAWPSLPVTLAPASVFAIDGAHAIVVGSEPSTGASPGLTHAFRLDAGTVVEIATRVAHTNAAAIASPIGVTGSVLLFGGAPEIESLGL